ncbi:MAG: hypothetical protein AB9903_25645 [Vulcanimicrobiota bacterium]
MKHIWFYLKNLHLITALLHLTPVILSVMALTTAYFAGFSRFSERTECLFITAGALLMLISLPVALFAHSAHESDSEAKPPLKSLTISASGILWCTAFIIVGGLSLCILIDSPFRFRIYTLMASIPLYSAALILLLAGITLLPEVIMRFFVSPPEQCSPASILCSTPALVCGFLLIFLPILAIFVQDFLIRFLGATLWMLAIFFAIFILDRMMPACMEP